MVRRLRSVLGADPLNQRPRRSPLLLVLTAGLAIATTALVWFGYLATREWRRSTVQLLERRAEEGLALLVAAIARDMKGAQVSVLVPTSHETLTQLPQDFREACARAFARFPYPESFFVWHQTEDDAGQTYFFNRADRPAAWDTRARTVDPDPYPVELLRNPDTPRNMVQQAREQGLYGRNFAVLETTIAGVPYQVVVHLLYAGPAPRSAAPAASAPRQPTLVGVIGFTVNMQWVRSEYFADIVRQVARIGGGDDMSLAVVNEEARVVASNGIPSDVQPVRERRFALLFFDPDLLSATSPPRPRLQYWTARVAPAPGSTLQAVANGATRTFLLISIAAVASFVGLTATARAARASAELATMRSEFVSTVTHELKTPLALIRLVSETLVKGRYRSEATIGDYARLLAQESDRLARLVDNLLTYARFSDVGQVYSFEAVDLSDLVEDALESFHPRLEELGFEVRVNVPVQLPRIRMDRNAMTKVVDNIIDNAIKYAAPGKFLGISAERNATTVHLEVADHGPGLSPEDSARVFDKFYRGRDAAAGGSGLGLTIAQRIVRDHGGRITMRSTPGAGTVVDVSLPAGDSA